MTVAFRLAGQGFTALDGGPEFRFTEAVSFVVDRRTQAEADRYWERMSNGGEPDTCGRPKDRFGLSWQIVPRVRRVRLGNADRDRANRVMEAVPPMGKGVVADREHAHERG